MVRLVDPEQRSQAERLLPSQTLQVAVHPEADPVALSAQVADPHRVALALAELACAGVGLSEFALGQPGLDEVFLALTGRPAGTDATTREDAA